MTRDVFHTIGCLFVVLLMMTSLLNLVSAADTDESSQEGGSDFKNLDRLARLVSNYMDNVRDEQRSLGPNWQAKRLLEMAFSGTDKRSQEGRRKRPCSLGIFSDNCRLSDLDAAMRRKHYLNGGMSPGKRSDTDSSFDLDQTAGSKRSCRFRLGGHCVTEALDKAARQYHYLNSADSPGRRRRSVRATNQLSASRDSEALKRSQRDVMEHEER